MDSGRDRDRAAGDGALERRLKQLIHAAVARCDACHRAYDLDDFAIVERRDHLLLVTATCAGCQTRSFITVALDLAHRRGPGLPALPPSLRRRGAPSDLTPADRARLDPSSPVTADDLLALHDFLDDFDGDFAALFGERR